MLHVTNGDSAADRLRAAGLAGEVLPWRDVLHEGPVPEGLDEARLRDVRADFIAALGWAEAADARADMEARDERLAQAVAGGEEIVLWFETDLYDVLQLVQVLDRLPPGRARVVITRARPFTAVTYLSGAELRGLLAGDSGGARERGGPGARGRCLEAGEELIAAARALWAAFRSAEPSALAAAAEGTPALPALAEAARRHLQQFPWRGTGLNRTERGLLEAVAAGAQTPVEAFIAQQRREERPFMGDATAFEYLRTLAGGREPLLGPGETLALSEHGEAVLSEEREWGGRPERWLGGVRLLAGTPRWRYDPATERLTY